TRRASSVGDRDHLAGEDGRSTTSSTARTYGAVGQPAPGVWSTDGKRRGVGGRWARRTGEVDRERRRGRAGRAEHQATALGLGQRPRQRETDAGTAGVGDA